MKRFLFSCLLMILGMSLSVTAQKTYTLVTAISNYDQSLRPDCGDLPMVTVAAQNLRRVLSKHSTSLAMLTGKNANHDNILAKLRSVCAAAGTNDRVIFYYGGHGSPGSICAFDKDVSFAEVIPIFKRSKAQQIICFFESCYSGTAISDKWNVSECRNLIMFTSSRPNEVSYGDGNMTVSGFFGKGLQNGLRGMCDVNKDRNITVIELFNYIYHYVTRRTYSHQHPQLVTSADNFGQILVSW